jgi:hypothetical protein
MTVSKLRNNAGSGLVHFRVDPAYNKTEGVPVGRLPQAAGALNDKQ